ncbi:MAG TPA: hypothetical protein VNU66_01790, partial [Mycobacteriales bacterium]|nr:hypothetical protein [Mycobacteriales bacterium]
MTRLPARALGVVLASGALLLAAAAPALAHPLGNFSVNTYSAVAVEPSAVRVDVVVDRAEIPTRQLFPDLDLAAGALPGGTAGPAADLCADVVRAASLEVDGRAVALQLDGSALTLPEGAAGLRTSRLVCALRSADLGDLVGSSVAYALADVSPAPGWRETTAVGDGVRVDADVPARSRSAALTAYPEDELAAPLDVPGTVLDVARGTGVVTGTGSVLDAPAPDDGLLRGADRLTTAFTGLVAQQSLTVPFAALAVLVAVALGALHAFAPGHGKTVIAAYLVGRRGTLRDAALLGLSVTVTHTLGVVLLGALLTVVGLAAPSEVYPVLGTASGLLLVGVGVVLLRAARRTRRAARARAVSPA